MLTKLGLHSDHQSTPSLCQGLVRLLLNWSTPLQSLHPWSDMGAALHTTNEPELMFEALVRQSPASTIFTNPLSKYVCLIQEQKSGLKMVQGTKTRCEAHVNSPKVI